MPGSLLTLLPFPLGKGGRGLGRVELAVNISQSSFWKKEYAAIPALELAQFKVGEASIMTRQHRQAWSVVGAMFVTIRLWPRDGHTIIRRIARLSI